MNTQYLNEAFGLTGKNIVVTGASSGIGRQCANSCSRAGANVILIARNIEKLEATIKELDQTGNHKVYSVDITDYERVEEVVSDIKDNYCEINGIINSAGISTTIPVKMVKPEKLNTFFNTNVTAGINLTSLLTRKTIFSEAGGSIIFLSSVMGVVGDIGKTIYGVSKGALISGTKSMAIELGSRNIRVNCISPGVVETPMSQSSIYSRSEESREQIKNLHPLGIGSVHDIANSCIYLLSDAGKWVTGTNLVVDGGYLAR